MTGDRENRAAVFSLYDSAQREDFTANVEILGKKNLTCYLFSPVPKTDCRVLTSSRPGGEGLTLHTITVRKGGELRTNSAGTLTIRSEGK